MSESLPRRGPPQSYYDRIDAGIGVRVEDRPARVQAAADIDPAAQAVALQRQKTSHRGLHAFGAIRRLHAYDVDASFLEEIAALAQLQVLHMERVTATELSVLGRLSNLRSLVIDSPTRIDSFAWTASLAPTLTALAIENARRIHRLDELAALTQLRTLAVEGSLHTSMHVASLEPLRALRELRGLFLTALRVEDGRLAPLAGMRELRVLEFADFYVRGEVDALAAALQGVRCSWFTPELRKHRWESRWPGRHRRGRAAPVGGS